MLTWSRREALRAFGASAVGATLFTREALADALRAAREIRRIAPSDRALATLTPHQNATVVALAEIIIPETDTPGATAARVNEFIDLILSEWVEPDQATEFLDGLDNVDARAQAAFGGSFVDGTQAQQVAIVEELDREVAGLMDADDPAARPSQHFFFQMKRLTLTGYYTSEVGMLQELHWVGIPGAYRPCEPLERLRRG